VTIENRPTCHRTSLLALPVLALWLLAAPVATYAQAQAPAQGAITPNYKDADLSQIIEAVSAVTGKNFIVDPRVRAQVTMLSSTPMTPQAFYEAFLSILQVHGFVRCLRATSSRSSRTPTRARCPATTCPPA